MLSKAKNLARDLIIPTIISVLCIVVALAGLSVTDSLRYDSLELSHLELWRLITPHFVHLSVSHLIMNLLGLYLVFVFFYRCVSWQYWLVTFFFSGVGISLFIFFLNPEIRWYVGLSGIVHALFMLGGLADIRVRKWEGITFTGLIIAKLSYEQIFGPLPGSEQTAGGPILIDAHLYGAIIGGIIGLFYLFKHK